MEVDLEAIEHEEEGDLEFSSLFMARLPNNHWELEIIKETLVLPIEPNVVLDWPPISSTPINEYTTEGLFDMAFPTLFPNGTALPMQPWARDV